MLFRACHFPQAGLCDLLKAARLKQTTSTLSALWHSALLFSHAEAMGLAIDRLKICRCDLCPFRARLWANLQGYSQALHAVTTARRRDALLYPLQAHLHFFFGDAIAAYRLASVALERTRGTRSACELFRYLASSRIPTRFDTATTNGRLLAHLSARIYDSADRRIVDLPLDLDIPSDVQTAWIEGGEVPPPPAFAEPPLAQDFDWSSVELVLRHALRCGEKMNPVSSNVRQHICFGLAYFQLLQMASDPLSLTMDRAVAAVGHWIRVYDPTAALFERRRHAFHFFATRNGTCIRQLAPYQGPIFKMLKNGVAQGLSADLGRQVRAAETVPALWDVIRSDCAAQYGGTIVFLRCGPYQNYDMGVAVAPLGSAYDGRLRRVDALWCHMMLLLAGDTTAEGAADFLDSAIRWVYEWMRLVPIVECSHFIGAVVFHAVVCAYFGVRVHEVKITPAMFQIEALLALTFEMFKAVVKQCCPITFTRPIDFSDCVNIVDHFPGYARRHAALWHVNAAPQFRRFFLRYMQAGVPEEPQQGKAKGTAQPDVEEVPRADVEKAAQPDGHEAALVDDEEQVGADTDEPPAGDQNG
jgi:hypothetical protein